MEAIFPISTNSFEGMHRGVPTYMTGENEKWNAYLDKDYSMIIFKTLYIKFYM